jgi:hypothetical protein
VEDFQMQRLVVAASQKNLAGCMPSASGAEEAKWNVAFWLQNELYLIGERKTEGGQLLQELLKA